MPSVGLVTIFWPLRKTVISSEIFRMSSRKCEMKMKLRPLAFRRLSGEEPLHLRGRQRGGRLVENDDARAGEEHAGDLDQLLQADRQRAHALARIDVDAEAGEMLARLAHHALPVDDAALHRLRAEEHVLRHRQVGHDGELLVHHADAGIERVAGGAEAHLAALDLHRAGEIGMHAGDDLHQRRLAGAVLADEAVDLAGAEREVDIAQRLHAAERL